jgi:hypothetical protein
MKWLSLILSILSSLRKTKVSDQSGLNAVESAISAVAAQAAVQAAAAQPAAVTTIVQPAAPGVMAAVVDAVADSAAVVGDVKEDIAALKAGQLPEDLLKQIQDAEKLASLVLTLGTTLAADFGVTPATLKNAIPEVIALVKKII